MSKFLYMLGTLVLEHMKRATPKPINSQQLVWVLRYDVDTRCPDIFAPINNVTIVSLRQRVLEAVERELR